MKSFLIKGGNPISGEVEAAGNKNAVLKMIPATLLTKEKIVLTKVPDILDVDVMLEIMKEIGSEINYDKSNQRLEIQTLIIKNSKINPELASKLRASNMFLGPLLGRVGNVENVFPGGDKIGPREMNAHFDGLTQLGAKFEDYGNNNFKLEGEMKGSKIFLYEPSVTATENIILAAVLAKGETEIENAACEPHVAELCKMLNKMGAKIQGIGSNKLTIEGVESVNGCEYQIPPDHIYVGTMLIIAAITNGELKINNIIPEDLRPILYFLSKLGVSIELGDDYCKIYKDQPMKVDDPVWARTKGVYSQPWPCFPTDLMSLMIILATQIEGSVLFFEKMYPGRMFFANYINGMGANIITADPHRIMVNGKTKLKGGITLDSPDLRAGMAYVVSALCAEGETKVTNIDHIFRGYPNIDIVLNSLGAEITRV
ncbi:UDP-N-acetylglucosamine 1-carboxyvinyltransferase [Candidatus Dojkabacteria bacterium]|nr:UDP-N-acetylglucosamine 1-carboxyvinyltransferase [Candidatus Dojkabacteria bacterium]